MNTIDPSAYEGDIVSRLRNWRGLHLAHGGELFEEAADEIERLRLTDAERYAVMAGLRSLERTLWADPENLGGEYRDIQRDAATLRGLLERMK